MALFLQFAIAVAIAYWFVSAQIAEGGEPSGGLAVLLVGVFGSWCVTKLYVLLRYGWKAMKSMSWDH